MAIPAPTEMALLHGSDALAPKKLYPIEQAPEAVVARDMHRVMKGSDPAAYTFPIDAPQGARVLVHTVNDSLKLTSVHLVDAVTGQQLDMARDITANSINTRHVPLVPSAPTEPLKDGSLVPQLTAPLSPIAPDPGFEARIPSMRVLTFDKPTHAGSVRLVVPADVQADGVWMEVQQPNTHLTVSAVVGELNHSFGDEAEVTVSVLSDAAPISDATLAGTIELPDHTLMPGLTFTALGNGTYSAKVPLASADPKFFGAWNVRVKATGTYAGASFERDVETAFGYYASHAQMTGLGTPVIARGADGLIDEISVDVDVETVVDDRFSVRGTLTYTGADGREYSLASAQTGQVVSAGTGTITLHFDAASMAYANIDGPFHLRDVALVSHAFGVTQHRIGRALDISTPSLSAREIRIPATIPLQVQDLMDNGDLARMN
jgi:hypothetical protein